MFDRNTVTGLVLIAAIMIGFFWYTAPTKQQLAQQQHAADSAAFVRKTKAVEGASGIKDTTAASAAKDSAAAAHAKPAIDSNGIFPPATTEKLYTIQNDVVKLTLSSKGGRVYSVELLNYKTWDKKPLILFDGAHSDFAYTFFAGNHKINTRDMAFTPTGEPFTVTGNDKQSFTLRSYAGNNKYFEQQYTLSGHSYMIDYHVRLVNLNNIIAANTPYINFAWQAELNKLELNTNNERNYTTVNYKPLTDDADRLSARGKENDKSIVGKTHWVAFNQHFFNSTIIYKDGFTDAMVKCSYDNDVQYLKKVSADMNLAYNHNADAPYSMQIYFGPNSYYDLKSYDIGLENIVPTDIGWAGFISKPINKYFFIPLFHWLSSFISNYGLIIFILTILIRLILSPLTYRSYVSAAKMKSLGPEIEGLRKKYADDQTRFGQEQMKLFQNAGVNPLGGCLPVLLQLPIFISMYSFFPASIELRQKSFLWANDLSSYDSIISFHFSLPLGIGDHLSLFTILYTISQVIYSAYNQQFTSGGGGAQAQQMKWMSYIFPLILFPVFNSLPAALTYYYLLSNLIAFAQQFIIQKFFINHAAILQQIEANKKKPKKTGGWVARLEQAQKEQQKQIQQRNRK